MPAIYTPPDIDTSGTVTTVSVVTANGFAGTVANPSSTPALTLKTGVTGLLKGNGTAVSAATPGTDYLAAGGAPSSHSFGVGGTPNLNDVTQPLFFDRAVTCDGLTLACGTAPSGGSLTVTLQTSTDGTTWASLASGAVSVTTGNYSGVAACATAIAANTFVRAKFTAVNSAADAVCTLFVRS